MAHFMLFGHRGLPPFRNTIPDLSNLQMMMHPSEIVAFHRILAPFRQPREENNYVVVLLNGLPSLLRELDEAFSFDVQHETPSNTTDPTYLKKLFQEEKWLTAAQINKSKTCAVCVLDHEVGARGIILPCHHIFHRECIEPWLTQHNTCPVCRYALPTERESAISKMEHSIRTSDSDEDSDEEFEVIEERPHNSVSDLSISEMKRILDERGVSYQGVIEKSELVRLIRSSEPSL